MGLLLRMAKVWLCDLRRVRVDPRFGQQILESKVCVRDPRVIIMGLLLRMAEVWSCDLRRVRVDPRFG